jgi:GxxExxY protein
MNKRVACRQQKPLTVMYGGKPVGDFTADVLIEGNVLVELKANKTIDRSLKINS